MSVLSTPAVADSYSVFKRWYFSFRSLSSFSVISIFFSKVVFSSAISSKDSANSCFSSCASRRHSWSVSETSWFFFNWFFDDTHSFFNCWTSSRSSFSFLLLSSSCSWIFSFSFSTSSTRSFKLCTCSLSRSSFVRDLSSLSPAIKPFSCTYSSLSWGQTWPKFSPSKTFPFTSLSPSFVVKCFCLLRRRFVDDSCSPLSPLYSLITLLSLSICNSRDSFLSSWWYNESSKQTFSSSKLELSDFSLLMTFSNSVPRLVSRRMSCLRNSHRSTEVLRLGSMVPTLLYSDAVLSPRFVRRITTSRFRLM